MNNLKKHKLVFTDLYTLICVLTLAITFSSCDDLLDKDKPDNTVDETSAIYILSEGLYNLNNSSLALYDPENKELISDYFLSVNKRGLGDTANDMAIYGSKLYIVVNTSGCIEVVDINTGLSLKQIKVLDDTNSSRQPRYITFYQNKAYVCNFDGTVCRIDTASLEIDGNVSCGKNPDGICVAAGKLYVSNSGGLNYPNYDNTVSVIDIAGFSEIKKITVDINPGKIMADSEGDVFVVSRGDYGENGYKFQKISSVSDELIKSYENIQALNFTINNDTAYIYNYDFNTNNSWIKTFDCKTEQIISENFIGNATQIETPYGIDVNPANGDVYITDAKSYIYFGNVFCFDRQGNLKFTLYDVGLNPNKVVFK